MRWIGLIFFLWMNLQLDAQFLAKQSDYERVSIAREKHEKNLAQALKASGISLNQLEILFVAFKEEQRLDVYLKSRGAAQFALWKSFPVCASSGELGPKSRQGDLQVPEGCYFIDRFNPASQFHLSLGLNYPNSADKKRSKASDLGGDIFIHGKCVTIGCLPMTDAIMEQLYVLAVHAKNNGQSKIPVYIFPFEFSAKRLDRERKNLHYHFWKSLEPLYQKFRESRAPLSWESDAKGNYLLKP